MPDDFWDRGYAVAPGLADAAQLAFVRAAMDASARTGRMRFADKIVPEGALNEYSPIAAEAVLRQCQPAIEMVTDRKLLPAYAFWRIYEHGATLRRHRDRNSCEISASLPIAAVPADQVWPIHVRDLHGTEIGVPLNPGDAIVYQGCRIEHWREPCPGDRQYQLFLHYVIEGGEQADYAFDRRAGLNLDG